MNASCCSLRRIFAHQEDGVEDDAGDDEREEDDAEDEQQRLRAS